MPIEIDKVCALEDAVDYVLNNEEYKKLIKNYSYSLNDLIHIITKFYIIYKGKLTTGFTFSYILYNFVKT